MTRCSSKCRTRTGSGYDVYSVIEHFFFPKFSISANPTALFAAAAQRTKQIRFRTMLHALPYHNAMVLAMRDRRHRHPHGRPVRVRGGPRVTAGSPRRPACRSTSTRARATRRRSTCCSRRSRTSASPTTARTSTSTTRRSSRSPSAQFRVTLGGTSDRTYELAAEHGWSVAVPPLLPYARSRSSSTCTGRNARSSGPSRTSSGSTPATWTRTARWR